MADWPIAIIGEHQDAALSRLTSQYDDATRLRALVDIHAERMQALENAAQSVLRERWVPEAVGVQLDELGAIVGEPRLGRDDTAYREAIELRISFNRSSGEVEWIFEFLARLSSVELVQFSEIFPAKIEIIVAGDPSAQDAVRVRQLVAAGVGIFFLAIDPAISFGHSEISELTPPDIDGFGELSAAEPVGFELSDGDALELSDNSLFGVVRISDFTLPSEGGKLAELYEV